MASSIKFLLFFSLNFFIACAISQNPILPKAVVLQVTKDLSTLQYVTKLFMGDNLVPVNLVLDLNGPLIWADCGVRSQNFIRSYSLECSMAKSSNGGVEMGEVNSKTCALQTENTISKISGSGELYADKLGLQFWGGVNSGYSLDKSGGFLFSCVPNLLLKGLANGAKGMLGLGNSRISLPSQVSSAFGFFQRKFSLCLSPSNGIVFLGGSSEMSTSMIYTPLISKDSEYYINVKSIKVLGKKLSFDPKGSTKISTIVPYTTLESNMYGNFVEAYVKTAKFLNLTLVSSVAPFEVCFSSKGFENKRAGANIPIVDLILQSEMVKWRLHGRNLMVDVSDEVMCLGILDGGLSQKESIVIGGYQLEDYLLEFNLGNSMLGVSSSLLMEEKKCSDFDASAAML